MSASVCFREVTKSFAAIFLLQVKVLSHLGCHIPLAIFVENKTGISKCGGESRRVFTASHFKQRGPDVLMMRLQSGKGAYKTCILQSTGELVKKKRVQTSKEKLRLMGEKQKEFLWCRNE